MKNNLTTTIIIGLAIATSTNLQAMTKARTLTQVAATYARNNKLKTTGIIIGGAIALDALQVGIRGLYHLRPSNQQKIKTTKAEYLKTDEECRKAYNEILEPIDHLRSRSVDSAPFTEEEKNKVDEAEEKYDQDPRVAAKTKARIAYSKLLFRTDRVSFLLRLRWALRDEFAEMRDFGAKGYISQKYDRWSLKRKSRNG